MTNTDNAAVTPARPASSHLRPRRPRRQASTGLPRARWILAALIVLGAMWLGWSRLTRHTADPSWSSLALSVPDLDCTFWCSVKVTTAMEAIDGACADRLDPSRRTLTIRFDPHRTTPAAIVSRLRGRGIRVEATKEVP